MLRVIDGFTPRIAEVRESALASGFNTWRPNKGEVGSSIYDGMNFVGQHAIMLHALTYYVGQPIYPNSMFFRVTTPETEGAYIHSDRESGQYTCIVYCSEHEVQTDKGFTQQSQSGTKFYKHRASGLREMPSFAELRQTPEFFDQLKLDMVEGTERTPCAWDELDYVSGLYNRGIIFSAPLFHSRYPRYGLGSTADDGRMVWVCHFYTELPS